MRLHERVFTPYVRKASCFAACVLFALGFASCSRPVSADVAATVNGRPVTYTSLNQTMAAEYPNAPLKSNDDQTTGARLEALRALIDQEIYVQRSEKAGLLASDGDVDAKYNELKAGYTEEQFQKLLTQRKMSVQDLKAQIRRELSVEKLFNKEIGARISISDAEVEAFFTTNKAAFNVPENTVHLAQILVTPTSDPNVHNLKNDKALTEDQARTKIQMLQLRLKQGDDFAALAQSYSEDPASSPNGGDLGMARESALDKVNPELRKAIMDMTPGQVSPILHTQEGYRLIKVLGKTMAGQRVLSDPRVQEEIRTRLFNSKDQLLRAAFVETARNEASVHNYYAESVLGSRDKK